MFITYHHAEACLDPRFDFTPAQLWAAVELDVQWPWFLVQVARRDRQDVIVNALFLQYSHDLEHLVSQQTPQAWIQQVQIVTPAHLNGQGGWAMEPLLEVCLMQDGSGERGLLFRAENNTRYSLHSQRNLDDLVLVKVLFSAESDLRRA